MVVEPAREVGAERVIPAQADPSRRPPPPPGLESHAFSPMVWGGSDRKEILFFLLLPNSAPSHL